MKIIKKPKLWQKNLTIFDNAEIVLLLKPLIEELHY